MNRHIGQRRWPMCRFIQNRELASQSGGEAPSFWSETKRTGATVRPFSLSLTRMREVLFFFKRLAHVFTQARCDFRTFQGVGDRGCQVAQRSAGIVTDTVEAHAIALAGGGLLLDGVGELDFAARARFGFFNQSEYVGC